MLNIAICDDEELVTKNLNMLLCDIAKMYSTEVNIRLFNKSTELVNDLKNGYNCDLLFLDIEMPVYNGVYVGKFIREELDNNYCHIVYISGNTRYAMELFETRPLNFIVKPFSHRHIEEVFSMCLKLNSDNVSFFEYRFRDCTERVPLNKILYFRSIGRKIDIKTKETTFEFYDKMESVFERVGEHNFIRIHKSYIVNDAYIIRFTPRSVIMSNGDELPISRSKKDEIIPLCKK